MSGRPFLSERMATVTIPRLRARGLETRLAIDGRTIHFDRAGSVVGPADVVIIWAAREPSASPGGSTDVIGTEGDLHGRPGELTVKAGDLFMLEGNPAEVTIAAKDIGGVAVAGFRMTSGGA